MERIEWKLLQAEDIEVRVQSVKNGKATMLLYQNARTAMDAFDEKFGEFGWQIRYEMIGDQLYGILSVYDFNNNRWIEKSDTGDESNIAKEKGQSSDILKRCAVRWGFARELYTSPKITIDDDGYGNSGYKVSEVGYNENRQMTLLKIVNRFGKEVFNWTAGQQTKTEIKVQAVKTETQDETKERYKQNLKDKCTILKNTGINTKEVLKFFEYYTKAIEQGWKGADFNAEKLWIKWTQPREQKVS